MLGTSEGSVQSILKALWNQTMSSSAFHTPPRRGLLSTGDDGVPQRESRNRVERNEGDEEKKEILRYSSTDTITYFHRMMKSALDRADALTSDVKNLDRCIQAIREARQFRQSANLELQFLPAKDKIVLGESHNALCRRLDKIEKLFDESQKMALIFATAGLRGEPTREDGAPVKLTVHQARKRDVVQEMRQAYTKPTEEPMKVSQASSASMIVKTTAGHSVTDDIEAQKRVARKVDFDTMEILSEKQSKQQSSSLLPGSLVRLDQLFVGFGFVSLTLFAAAWFFVLL